MIENKMKSGKLTQSLTPRVEFIKKFNSTRCYHCDGTGFDIAKYRTRVEAMKHPCSVCKGTGRWNEDTFDLIATLPNGQKIAFRVDGIK